MKKFLIGMTLAVAALSMVGESIARPMGGGRSIGRQSSSVSRMNAPAPAPRPAPAQANRPAAPVAGAPATPVKQPSRFGGLLGGALLGLGVGALLSHFGMGAGLASALGSIIPVILLGLAAFFLYRWFRRRNAPASAPFQGFNSNPLPAGGAPEIGSRMDQPYQPQQPAAGGFDTPAPAPHVQWGVPADFDSDSFLRTAKTSFVRLQAAWDRGDVADLNQFTTPEVFAELKMQIQERGVQKDFTDVVSIDAQVLGIETVNNEYMVSVQFNGMIKPAADALAEPFAEVWNMSKPVNGSSGWVLAGIQQLPQ
ncbi:Tim44 domain-containing protein [Massilia sp. S19_KUP03_FR1]|uniref:Tim44 domain-containing protein n=1 Tax=Massilia sp. S19_KUP03_FR1 TaxID=3025503 RepID=UPI002FCD90FD